ncbi:MAG: GH25 family lysozyme [Bacteroidia bacterium]
MAGRGKAFGWLIALLILAGVGAVGWWFWDNRFPIRGIDVSHYQGEIDWARVKADGIRFAFVKATEGVNNVDSTFAANMKGAKAAGVKRGAYHFFHPNLDGSEQAKHFLSQYTFKKGDLAPVLDLEVTDNVTATAIRREALEWLEAVESATGKRPIIYTLPHYARSYLDASFSKYPLWVVDLNPFLVRSTSHWTGWQFWQHNHHGGVDGIEGDVDLNVFSGTEAEFSAL